MHCILIVRVHFKFDAHRCDHEQGTLDKCITGAAHHGSRVMTTASRRCGAHPRMPRRHIVPAPDTYLASYHVSATFESTVRSSRMPQW
jgi:hypothetical protein